MRVVTNRVPRHIVYGYELSEKEKADFDFLKSDELDDSSFFRYRGQVYYLGNFMRFNETINGIAWNGCEGDSYFSGTLVKLSDDRETVIVGRYYS
jgi:hypothetical protein